MLTINNPSKSKHMKYILSFLIFGLLNTTLCNAQTKTPYINTYIKSLETNGTIILNHGPLIANWGTLNTASVFFITTYDTKIEAYNNHAVLYDHETFTAFGFNDIDPSFGDVVISVFFDNLDHEAGNELIVIYELGGRTYFADGGYAGMKNYYQTRVFKCKIIEGENVITEYKAMGDLLTINLPLRMGTMHEEELIGREDSIDKLNDVLGVTYNANQVKKRIKLLKDSGLLRTAM